MFGRQDDGFDIQVLRRQCPPPAEFPNMDDVFDGRGRFPTTSPHKSIAKSAGRLDLRLQQHNDL